MMDAPFGFEMSLISLPLSGQLHYYLRLPSRRKSIGLLKERGISKNCEKGGIIKNCEKGGIRKN
jgi:hypothetical protein